MNNFAGFHVFITDGSDTFQTPLYLVFGFGIELKFEPQLTYSIQ